MAGDMSTAGLVMTAGLVKTRRIAAVLIGVALIAGVLVVAAGAATATSSPPACSVQTDNHWPGYTQGRPAGIDPRTTSAIYMWHDNGSWHLRVTHRTTNLRSFSGQLVTAGTFAAVHPVHLEKSDQFQVSADKHTITFFFKNYGQIDGVNFATHCAPSIKFAFQSNGQTSPASKIVIGKSATRPSTNPFEIARVPNTTTTTTASSCPGVTDDPWPAWVQGRPGVDPNLTSSIFMWHSNGWHIRVTHHGKNLESFSGQLTTAGTFVKPHAVNLEKNDEFVVSPDKHGISFLFKNYGSNDGLDFYTACAPSITFTFQSDGQTSAPANIVIGSGSARPTTNPFQVTRTSTSPTPVT
jgi:hypothetical protein